MIAKNLGALDVPGPTITSISAPFWRAAAEGRLQMQHCEDCGRTVFDPRGHCPHCWGRHLTWCDASGFGSLKSFSTVHKPGHPGWLPVAPYTVGLIELDEGPTMLTFVIAGDGGPPPVGAKMQLAPTYIGARRMPCFRESMP
jgi:uncharacterized protein